MQVLFFFFPILHLGNALISYNKAGLGFQLLGLDLFYFPLNQKCSDFTCSLQALN